MVKLKDRFWQYFKVLQATINSKDGMIKSEKRVNSQYEKCDALKCYTQWMIIKFAKKPLQEIKKYLEDENDEIDKDNDDELD